MKIEETKSGRTLVVAVDGRLDARSAPSFQDQLLGRIEGGETALLLDLSGLDFLSSAGLRVLLIVAKRLRDGDGRFAVCSLRDNIDEVFRISGFASIIDIHPDRQTALAQLA